MELLDELRLKLGLEYISDVRLRRPYTARVLALACSLPPAGAYNDREWDEAVRYLMGRPYSTAECVRAAVLGLLLARAEGGDSGWRLSP